MYLKAVVKLVWIETGHESEKRPIPEPNTFAITLFV